MIVADAFVFAALFAAQRRAAHPPGLALLTSWDIVGMLVETLLHKPEGSHAAASVDAASASRAPASNGIPCHFGAKLTGCGKMADWLVTSRT
jgi:hypothetical protein